MVLRGGGVEWSGFFLQPEDGFRRFKKKTGHKMVLTFLLTHAQTIPAASVLGHYRSLEGAWAEFRTSSFFSVAQCAAV